MNVAFAAIERRAAVAMDDARKGSGNSLPYPAAAKNISNTQQADAVTY